MSGEIEVEVNRELDLDLLGYLDVLIESSEESIKNINDNPAISKSKNSQSLWLKKYTVELYFQKEIKKRLLILFNEGECTEEAFEHKYYTDGCKITEIENIKRIYNIVKNLINE